MVFDQFGVYMHDPRNVKVLAAPILFGGRNKKNRLFYLDLSQGGAIAKVGNVDDQGPLTLADGTPSEGRTFPSFRGALQTMGGPFLTMETLFRTLKDECRTLADHGFKGQGPKLSPTVIAYCSLSGSKEGHSGLYCPGALLTFNRENQFNSDRS